MPLPLWSRRFVQWCLVFFQWPLEAINTKFSRDRWNPERRKILRKLFAVPKMSTVAIGAFVNRLVESLPPDQAYLNIGVWYGYSLFAGMLGNPEKRCIGVDTFRYFSGPRRQFLRRFHRYRSPHHEFFAMDWRQYFVRGHHGSIGLLFYDAEHDYESQHQALTAAAPFLAPGAYILVDDTNEDSPRRALVDFLMAHPDIELLYDISTAGNCHPTYWNGLMVARKRCL